MLAGVADQVAVIVKDLRARMTESIDRLVNVADSEENIFAPDQFDQLRLLLVNVLKLVKHDLTELGADTIPDIFTRPQQLDRAPFEVIEIEITARRFSFTIETLEAKQNVEYERTKI